MFLPLTMSLSEEILERADRALDMELMDNADPLDVYRETGVFRHASDHKIEISDKESRILDVKLNFRTLDEPVIIGIWDLFQHDELKKNTRNLDDVVFHIYPEACEREGVLGSLSIDNKKIEIYNWHGTDKEELRGIILHELQHIIQNRARWNMGGNARMFDGSLVYDGLSREERLNELAKLSHDYGHHKIGDWMKKYVDGFYDKRASEITHFLRAVPPEHLHYVTLMETSAFRDNADSHFAYESLFGEIEANSVMLKKDWTLEESMKHHPYEPKKHMLSGAYHFNYNRDGLLYLIHDGIVRNSVRKYINPSLNKDKIKENELSR